MRNSLYRIYAATILIFVLPIIVMVVSWESLVRGYRSMMFLVHLRRQFQEWFAWWKENVIK